MIELSPAAQAVYEAAIEQSEYPNDAQWVVVNALRAAANIIGSCNASTELHRIADELEALP